MRESARENGGEVIGHRIKIMALNVGSFFAKQKAIECYIHDHEINVIVLTETNVTEDKIHRVKTPKFTCANHCCRQRGHVKGG